MKTKKILFLALLLGAMSFAQNGINYKAVIKDGTGSVVANQLVQVQLAILEGIAQTTVYSETHSPTTDANGIVILEIGTGAIVIGTYAAVAWATDDHFLNVQVNTGGGLVDLGSTKFMSVPYSINAQSADIATSISKLPEPHILGRSTQASSARFSYNNKQGWQAAQAMCENTFPNDPNVRAFTLEQIAQAIVLGNWDTMNINNINNVNFWAISPYAVGSNFGSYTVENQNSYGLNYNSGDIGNGTRGRILINASTPFPGFNDPSTYLSVQTNIANGLSYPCMCGTYKN